MRVTIGLLLLGLIGSAHAAGGRPDGRAAPIKISTRGLRTGKALTPAAVLKLTKVIQGANSTAQVDPSTIRVFTDARAGTWIHIRSVETVGGLRMSLDNKVNVSGAGELLLHDDSRTSQIETNKFFHRFDNDPRFRSAFQLNTNIATQRRVEMGF